MRLDDTRIIAFAGSRRSCSGSGRVTRCGRTGRVITAYPINTATAIDPVTGQQVVLNSPTPVRANPALPKFPIVAPPTQGGDEHRDGSP